MTQNLTTREVTVASHDGKSFGAYLAVPASGHGPGLVLCQEIFGVNDFMRRAAQLLAEEGYVVLVPDLFWRQLPGIQLTDGPADMPRAFELYQKFDVGVGVLGYCLGGKLAYLAACRTDVDVAIGYYGVGIENSLDEAAQLRGRLVLHIAEQDGFCPPEARQRILEALGNKPGVQIYVYPGMDHAFARTGGDHYDKPSALMAHQRSMAALQRAIGPEFDYSYLWDKHCEYEFGTRDVAATMATMVAEPYVNHIPTMTGGVGHKELSRFYQHHFVNSNPPDTRLVPLSRTVGATQIVDELLFCFTHTTEIDWLLPGVKPTGKYVEIPLIAIVKFRGDKLYHEHIYWDQASVLVQVGLLDPKGLPVAGRETAAKLLDETLPSNTLMARWKESENK
jgi:carboxymethylenebutenolidase